MGECENASWEKRNQKIKIVYGRMRKCQLGKYCQKK